MNLWVKKVQQILKSNHISFKDFEIPVLLPSSTTDEIIGKLGQEFQEDNCLNVIDICNIWGITNQIVWGI